MRFYNRQHRHYCGIDLHVKTMYVCILDAHRPGARAPQRAVDAGRRSSRPSRPYRDGLVVAAECMFTWYWLADVCAAEGIPFVLGHALAMKAIHGGKAKNDRIDSHKIAVLLRGGMLPQAYVYPAAMRSTRDLLRRRLHLVRKRGQLLAHIQNTRAQYNLPVFGRKLAYPRQSRRGGGALPRSECAEEHRGRPRADRPLRRARHRPRAHDRPRGEAPRCRRVSSPPLGAGHRQGPGADDPLRDPRHHAL